MRIEFSKDVDAFAAYFIDNDFTNVSVSAYDSSGILIEQIVIPMVPEGGVGYHGIDAAGISLAIIEGADGQPLESTFIDDLTFIVSCEADVDGDWSVGITDFLAPLAWRPCE